uniref:Outer membrane protein OmpH n=1 Tax=Chlorobium chlorochromatii (strain CaD3) TaxID=340177 RepID=Q3AQM1_CHLCH
MKTSSFFAVSRRIATGVMLSLTLAAPQAFAAQESGKIGVIDSAKILQQLADTKQAESALQAAAAPMQKELDRMNQDYQQAVAAYRQKAATLAKTAREQKEKELTTKGKAIEKYQQDNFGRGGALEKKQQELFSPVRQKVLTAVEAIAQKEGISVVVEKNSAIYATTDADITYKVLNQLNVK